MGERARGWLWRGGAIVALLAASATSYAALPPAQGLTMPAAQVRKELYVAAALASGSAELDVLAGAVVELASLSPNATAAELRTAIGDLWTLLRANSPNVKHDFAGTPERQVSRLLGRIVSALPAGSRDAVRAYGRKYATAVRAGLDQTRALTRMESLYDQQGAYEVFRRDVWGRFVDAARARAVLATVVNEAASPFVQVLAVHTSDTAIAILDARNLEPLETFVRTHLQPSGAVVANGAEVDGLVGQAGQSATTLARAYANNLFTLNRAQEVYLQGASSSVSAVALAAADPAADLKRAIETAKGLQTNLDKTLKDVRGVASGTLGFVSGWLKFAGFEEDAADVEKVAKAATTLIDGISKASNSAISWAQKIAKIFPADGEAAAIIGSAVLTGNLISVAVQVFSIFGGGAPDKMAQVLAILKEIKEIVVDMKEEMHARFDRIDDKLNRMLDTIVEYFALVNWEIGETQVQVAEVQAGLYELQSELSRLERNVYTFMSALSHQPLLESITGNLRYLERTGAQMPYTPTYVDAENDFYAWGRELSRDELLAGPLQRSYADDALLTELTNFPLATNINYLSQFPQARLALPPLATSRLSNPLDWGVASESYAQLAEEWPAHAARIAPSRLADLRDSGRTLANALNAIASPALFTKLAQHYQTSFTALRTAIGNYERDYEQDPTNKVYGVDLWSGPNQVPTQSDLSQTKDLRACSGKPLGTVSTLPFTFKHADYMSYGALMLGDNLGAGTLGACIDGEWAVISAEPTGLGGTVLYKYQLNVVVRISYSGTAVVNHRFTTTVQRQNLWRPNVPPFNPITTWPPEPLVAEQWSGVRSLPSAVNLAASPSLMEQIRSGVTQKLLAKQRDFYTKVAQRCRLAGNPINAAVRVLSGSRKLWESYVVMGLPTALEQSDYLRSLLYGNGAVFTGTDLGDDDGLLNDVEDVYTYTATHTLPAQNLMVGLNALQAERAANLRDEINRILVAIQTAGEREGEDLVRSTLMRLSILPQAQP